MKFLFIVVLLITSFYANAEDKSQKENIRIAKKILKTESFDNYLHLLNSSKSESDLIVLRENIEYLEVMRLFFSYYNEDDTSYLPLKRLVRYMDDNAKDKVVYLHCHRGGGLQVFIGINVFTCLNFEIDKTGFVKAKIKSFNLYKLGLGFELSLSERPSFIVDENSIEETSGGFAVLNTDLAFAVGVKFNWINGKSLEENLSDTKIGGSINILSIGYGRITKSEQRPTIEFQIDLEKI